MHWRLRQYCHHRQLYVVSVDELLPAKANGRADTSKLWKWTEETDSRLVFHVEWVVRLKQCM